jgi:hypothetical protein
VRLRVRLFCCLLAKAPCASDAPLTGNWSRGYAVGTDCVELVGDPWIGLFVGLGFGVVQLSGLTVVFGRFTMPFGGTLMLGYIADTFRRGVVMNVGSLFMHPA